MERLTYKFVSGRYCLDECRDLSYICPEDCGECEAKDKAFNKLGEYEDTGLTPGDINTMANEIETRFLHHMERHYGHSAGELLAMYEAAKEGRVLVLPCPIGAKVYLHSPLCWENGKATFEGCKFSRDCTHWRGFECPLKVVEGTFNVTMYKRVGKTYWLTPEEAEAAIPADQRPRP